MAFARKADAQRFLTTVEHAILDGRYVDPNDKTTFAEYAETWRVAQVHRRTTADKIERILRRHANPAFGAMPMRTIRPSHIQSWVKAMSLTLAPATVAVIHGVVSSVFKSAVRDRRIPESPCVGTKLPGGAPRAGHAAHGRAGHRHRRSLPPRYARPRDAGRRDGRSPGRGAGLTVDRSGLQPPSLRPMLRVDRQLVVLQGEAPYLGPPKRRASYRSVPLPESPSMPSRHTWRRPRRSHRKSCAATRLDGPGPKS